MEFVTTDVGSIKGGNARKHLIYFQAATGEWWFDQKLFRDRRRGVGGGTRGIPRRDRVRGTGNGTRCEHRGLRGGPALVNKTLWPSISRRPAPDQLPGSPPSLPPGDSGTPARRRPSLGTTSLNRSLLRGLRACAELEWIAQPRMSERLALLLRPGSVHGRTARRANDECGEFIAEARSTRPATTDSSFAAQTEDEARKLLDESAGQMTEEQVQSALRALQRGLQQGTTRRYPILAGLRRPNGKRTYRRTSTTFNAWTGRMWKERTEELAAVGEVLVRSQRLALGGHFVPNDADVPP